MPRRSGSRLLVTVLSLTLLTIACTAAQSGLSPTESVARASTTATASLTPVAAPSLTAAGPPSATLAAEGGDSIDGQLGSFTWNGAGSDSPWLPGAPVAVGAGEPLTVTIGDGVAVDDWSARQIPAGTANGAGAQGLGDGPAPITFSAPGPGSWSVQVLVRFGGGIGSAAYYWQLTVR